MAPTVNEHGLNTKGANNGSTSHSLSVNRIDGPWKDSLKSAHLSRRCPIPFPLKTGHRRTQRVSRQAYWSPRSDE